MKRADLHVCEGVSHGSSASEGYHNPAAAPPNQTLGVQLQLPEELALLQAIQAECCRQTQHSSLQAVLSVCVRGLQGNAGRLALAAAALGLETCLQAS